MNKNKQPELPAEVRKAIHEIAAGLSASCQSWVENRIYPDTGWIERAFTDALAPLWPKLAPDIQEAVERLNGAVRWASEPNSPQEFTAVQTNDLRTVLAALEQAQARADYNWKILRECADILCLPDESPSLLPEKIRVSQLCRKSEREAKIERGNQLVDALTRADAAEAALANPEAVRVHVMRNHPSYALESAEFIGRLRALAERTEAAEAEVAKLRAEISAYRSTLKGSRAVRVYQENEQFRAQLDNLSKANAAERELADDAIKFVGNLRDRETLIRRRATLREVKP